MNGRRWVLAVAGLVVGFSGRPAAGQEVRSRVDSLLVGGILQAQFNTTSADDDAEPDGEWEVRRARIGMGAYVGGWIEAVVVADFARGRARLKDGYARLRFDRRLTVRAGQFKVPFDALELTSSGALPVIERDPIPRGAAGSSPNGIVNDLGYSDRDIGLEWSGRWPDVSVTAGIYNGAGENADEIDDGKQLAARVAGELPAGWELAGAWSGLRVNDPPAAADAAWYHAFEVTLERGGWAEPGWRVLGQVLAGDDYDPAVFGDDDATFLALQGLVAYHVPVYRVPYLIGWEPVLRVGWTSVDDGVIEVGDDALADLDDLSTTIATAGVNLFWRERVVTQVQLDWVDFEAASGAGDRNASDVAFRAQLGFAF